MSTAWKPPSRKRRLDSAVAPPANGMASVSADQTALASSNATRAPAQVVKMPAGMEQMA